MEIITSPIAVLANATIPDSVSLPGGFGNETPMVLTPAVEDSQRLNGYLNLPSGIQAEKVPLLIPTTPSGKAIEAERLKLDAQANIQKAKARGGLSERRRPDVMARKFKKRMSKSTENKIRDLFAFREDLIITLSSLIPAYQQASDKHEVCKADTNLCSTCSSKLAHLLYYSPARFEPYLSEHSTRAYLTIIDDAETSLKMDLPIQSISHHDLECILRGELSVVEYRISLKMADFHKKTAYLNHFPLGMGHYAQLNMSSAPALAPEGFFSRLGKKGLSSIGLGNGSNAAAAVNLITG